MERLRIAVIGQSNFAADVLDLLLGQGHEIVGVFTIPDKGSREDILGLFSRHPSLPSHAKRNHLDFSHDCGTK